MTDRHEHMDWYARTIVLDDGLVAPYGGSLVQAFVPAHDRPVLMERLADMPRVQISEDELLDLEMLACGALSPLTGFMTRGTYESVLAQACLPGGRPWGLPVTLAVTREAALSICAGQEVALWRGTDPVGVLHIEEIYPWNADAEAGALGPDAGAGAITARRARRAAYLVGGPVTLFAARAAEYMQHRHLWPLELRGQIVQRGWRQVAVPHTRYPWQRTHEYLLKCALEASDALLLHAPAQQDSDGPQVIPPELLVDASRMLIENYFPVDRVLANPVPAGLLARTPRAALTHAILSQNYGAGLFFLPEAGSVTGAYELFGAAARHGLALQSVLMPAAFHCEPCGGTATPKSCPHAVDQRLTISDEEIAVRLRQGESLPPLVTRPEIARALARGMAEYQGNAAVASGGRHIFPHASEVSRELRQSLAGHKACALWMTGLSGSGKSTIAQRLERELLLAGHRVFVVDGDTLRHGLNHDLGFSEIDRRENLRRAAEVVKVMVEAGLIVIASFISPFRAERQAVREILGASFHEVYVEASLEACEQRDPKGLYKRARAGQIPQFTGISSPYEPPVSPAVSLNTSVNSVEQCVAQMHDYLAAQSILRATRSQIRSGPATSALGPMRIQ